MAEIDPVVTSELTLALANLEEGKRAVEAAERQLETVLSDIRVAPRAEKTSVSRAIEAALERLKLARGKVAEAEKMLAGVVRR